MRFALTLALAVATALSLAPVAQAQGTNAPPGNSGLDQYLETVPNASGSHPPKQRGKTGSASSPLTPRQRKGLESMGADGRALVAATAATIPADAVEPLRRSAASEQRRAAPRGGKGRSRAGGDRPRQKAAKDAPDAESAPDAKSGTAQVLSGALAATGADSGGMGIALPGLLVLTLAAAAAVAVSRHRRTDAPTDGADADAT